MRSVRSNRPPIFVGDFQQQRHKFAAGYLPCPATQPELRVGWDIALDCEPATNVWTSRPGFPRPGQRSTADAVEGLAAIAQCSVRPPLRHSEERPKLLILLGPNFAVFSECPLTRKEKCSVLETGALAIELHSYGAVSCPLPPSGARAHLAFTAVRPATFAVALGRPADPPTLSSRASAGLKSAEARSA